MAEFKERPHPLSIAHRPSRDTRRETRDEGRSPARDALRRTQDETGGTRMPTRQQTQCRFCRRGDKYVDYKDIETLQKLLTHRGKIYSRKRSGNCAGCQRKVKRAIQRARYMALLPFCA